MAKSKDDKLEEINSTLGVIAENLADISAEIYELRSSLQVIGTMLIMDSLAEKHPELKEQLKPLAQEWIEGLKMAMAEDEEQK